MPDKDTKVGARQLTEEQRHNMYSVEAAEKDYAESVYYKQRKGGTDWFHGRVSKSYRDHYSTIFGKGDDIGRNLSQKGD